MKPWRRGLALAVVRDLQEHRAPSTEDELADFETDVLAGFVLARASAGLVGVSMCRVVRRPSRATKPT